MKLPLSIEQGPDSGNPYRKTRYAMIDASGEEIATNRGFYPCAPEEEDAEFIVRACNAYDDLVAALEACYERLASHDEQSVPELIQAQAAIKLAKEGK